MPHTESKLPPGPKGFRVFRTPAGIQFSPPRESDALFDALRIAYPEGKSHFERVLNAVGEFVREEGWTSGSDDSKRRSRRQPAKEVGKVADFSVNSQTLSKNMDKPCSQVLDGKPKEVHAPIKGTGVKRGKKNGEFQSMTTVWSTETKSRYQYRPRRPMTEEERMDYKTKRVMGVCAPCKKRKRKVSNFECTLIATSTNGSSVPTKAV
jgi:hypothetical protein